MVINKCNINTFLSIAPYFPIILLACLFLICHLCIKVASWVLFGVQFLPTLLVTHWRFYRTGPLLWRLNVAGNHFFTIICVGTESLTEQSIQSNILASFGHIKNGSLYLSARSVVCKLRL